MKYLIFFVSLYTLQICSAQESMALSSRKDFSIGDVVTIKSNVLDEERVLNIYLPASYKVETEKEYPVIYVLDGSHDEDIIHIAGIVQFCSFSWIDVLPESIVVGIANVDRKRDFTFPTSNKIDKEDFPTSGGSKKFISFINDELKPAIANYYRTTEESTIIGQSLGGLLATEILFTSPKSFQNYIIVSPSLWWDDERLLLKPINNLEGVQNVYVAVGDEGDIMERTARDLYSKLDKQKTARPIFFNFLKEQSHGDALHLAVYDAFEKFSKNRKE